MVNADGVIFSVLTAVLLLAVWQDVREHKIHNWLVVGTAVAGLLLSVRGGGRALGYSLLSCIIVLTVGGVLWVLGTFHAGDAKLYAALAALMGLRWAVSCFAWSMLVGGVVGVVLLLREKAFRQRIRRVWVHFKCVMLSQTFSIYEADPETAEELPLALAIAAGGVLTIWFPLL